MSRMMLLMLFCSAGLLLAGCGKSGSESIAAPSAAKKSAHGQTTPNAAPPQAAAAPGKEMIPVIQGQKLPGYGAATIGEAFNAYHFFDRKEWQESKAEAGKFYVDYVGWFKPALLQASEKPDAVKGVEVKFVIYPDGNYYLAMVSKIQPAADGKLTAYPVADTKGVIDAIYADKKITF